MKNNSPLERKPVCGSRGDGDQRPEYGVEDQFDFGTNFRENAYKCDVCSKVFAKKYNLNAHKRALHSPFPNKHVCDVCGKEFAFKSNYNTHRYTHMDMPRNFKCSVCPSAFKNARGLKNHLKTHDADKNYVCEICGKKFTTAINLKNHKSAHSELRPYYCEMCQSAFKRPSHLQQHQKEVHGVHQTKMARNFACDECSNSFTTRERLEVHKRKHTGELPFQCDKCWRGFASQMGLNVHHTMGECQSKTSSCKTCNLEFKPGEEPCVHVKLKRNKTPADKSHRSKAAKVLRKDKPRNFECELCNKTFIFNCDKRQHIRTCHTDERPFVCDECGKAFKAKNTLQNHQAVHSDSRPYPCTYCEKRFRRSEQLMLHTRTHTGEKPHICNFCGRGFAQIGDMKKHRKIHNRVSCRAPGNECASESFLRETPHDNPDGNPRESKRDPEQDDQTLTYGETQVNLIRANIFKKRTVNSPFKRWLKCTHCLTTFSTKASLTRHLKRFNCKEESRELKSLSYLSLSEIKEAIYGSKYKKKTEEKNAVPVIHETVQSQLLSAPDQPGTQGSHSRQLDDQQPEALLNCDYCTKTFTQKRTLNAHLTTHQKQRHLCPICGKQFSYKSSLVSHQIVHQKLPRSHTCTQCDAAFTTQRSLRRHYYTHYNYRDKEFICELCGKRFAYSMTLKNHKLAHSEERPHVCRICGTSFKRTTHLRTHEQGVHGLHDGLFPKKYTCAICQKSLVKKESLEAHMKEHTGELNFQCNDCHKKFTTNTGLNIHTAMGRCHPFVRSCDVCSKEFRGEDPLCEHLHTTSTKRRQAKVRVKRVGERSSEKKSAVPRHMKERNYFCKVCGKHYIYPCELKTHFRLAHTDEKPFVCGRCGKAFKTKASLQMHEDVHNDLRPYKCDICEKRFRKTEHVKLHIRTHTGEKPHVCDICGRGFAQKGDMKKHIVKTHNKALPRQSVPPVLATNSVDKPENAPNTELNIKTEEVDIPYDSCEGTAVKQEEALTFTCVLCCVSLPNEFSLKRHVRNVHLPTRVKCNLCSKEMTRKSFRRHSREVHGLFPSRGKHLEEIGAMPAGEGCLERAEAKGEGSSASAGEGTLGQSAPAGEDSLEEQSNEPESIDPCEMLCKVEMNEGSTEGEKKVNLSFKGVECKICHQMYSNKLNLKKHVYNVHRMVRVKCHICDKEVNKKSLDRHMKSVHSAKVELKKERKTVPEEEKIPCMLCDKKCLNMLSLQNHIRNIHEAEQFKCSQCEFQGIRRLLEKHMKKEHNDEVHQCPRCQKILKSKSTLKEHMLIHTDDRRFICDICGMRFKRTSNYHGHLKSHQEKKFQCQLCGNFFLRKRYLAVHEQTIHNYYGEGVPPQEKGYQCEVCGVKLKWKNNLLAHMRIHTGEKPYKCNLCGENFTCHGSLRTHVAKHGVCERSEQVEGRLDPLEVAALSCVLEIASLQLFIIDVGTCSPSPHYSNIIARRKISDVIERTKEEIEENGTFRVLIEKAKEEVESRKAAKLLQQSLVQNQLQIAELKSKLRGHEYAKARDMNEKQEVIAQLKDKIHEEITKNDLRLRYIDRWEAARQNQNRMRCESAEAELERKLEEVANKYNNEIRVHDEICTFLALEEKVLLEELEKWKETYEKEMKRRTAKIRMLEVKTKEQQVLHHKLSELYEEQQKEMNEYLELKEKIKHEEERNKLINEMATKIQAWWRGTMVRRGLGTFKKKKKLGKEKKK